mgnify:CR=1 FL=1
MNGPTCRQRHRHRTGALLVLLLAAAWLAGCAGSAPERPREIATVSDQGALERRARVRLELASAYYSRGQYVTALDEVKQALQIAPNLADAYNLRGLVYAGMGEEALADDSFRQALQLNPGDGATLHNRAWSLCQRERYADAQAQFQAALDQPQYRDIIRTQFARGVCYARAGNFTDAERALRRAYELDPANPNTGFSLSEVLFKLQQYERARFYVGRVNDTPDFVNAQTLWLALRIERKLGRDAGATALAQQLRSRFPQSAETAALGAERFDD